VPRDVAPDPQLAAALRGLRERAGITREGLAYEAGITTGSLARVELGQSVPSWATVRSIAVALGVSLAELAAAIEAES